MAPERIAHRVDVHVGRRLRQRRWARGWTQQQLAEQVGIRFQQIQKYETGENRLSASRLWDIAQALEVPVSYFFEGLEEGDDVDARASLLSERETLALVRAYYAIPPAKRASLLDLARILGKPDPDAPGANPRRRRS